MPDGRRTRLWLALFVSVIANAAVFAAEEPTTDSLEVVKQKLSDRKAALVDVREKKEWTEEHLQAAQLLPLSELKRLAGDPAAHADLEKKLPKSRIVYCHCASGIRSLRAAEILRKLGYDARPLKQSYDDLRQAGFTAAAK
ncbi:MAG TPA: rhodanese-like domain-containing protein [Pirellulales bacterium]|jgi:phage shock protein E|nr:rhodanese-like domain-containing protein [Pirellulales bacterium]